ncbi:recombinase family protein [Phenylobacterium sp.]|uniref:recombinase family protein n=1 Tax=Phenylobacterium sp. TaxID=1871053 RepID=UPI001200FDEB|nr:recombinase family protein [Phenylobacterium sp.]THD60767.1 MAG: recombinase family protein [Phenylobacterium sp.]
MDGYFAYIRVSTVKQGERGTSLDEQRSAIEAYASRHSLSIDAWFQEMETAAKRGRRQFARMLAQLAKRKARGVIIHKIDRSARNLRDWAQLGELMDVGVEVHFAHEALDLTSRGGRLSADIQAVVAADYIRNLRQEVVKGFYGRLKQGLFPMAAPRGYLDQGGGKPKVIDPVSGPLVRQAFELYGSGHHTFHTLREEMHRRGLCKPSGGPISLKGITVMLRNPFYTGLIRIARTGETFEGVHEPLVGKALFDRVQAIIDGRLSPRPNRHDFTFRRLIRCVACGYSLIGESRKGHVYYRCHTPRCRGTILREPDIEAQVRGLLVLLTFTEDELIEIGSFARALDADLLRANDEQRAHIERDLALCGERLARLTDALIDGLVDKETFEFRKAALYEQRLALREALDAPRPVPFSEQVLAHLGRANMAYLSYEAGFPDEKRKIVQSLTSDFLADGKSLEITMRNIFREVIEWRKSTAGAPDRDSPRTSDVTPPARALEEELGRLVDAVAEAMKADPEHGERKHAA